MVQFGEITAQANVVGTVRSMIGAKGHVDHTLENFYNPDPAVRIQVTLVREDGLGVKANCSPRVSELLRSKEIGFGEIFTFPITEQKSLSGQDLLTISMPAIERHHVITQASAVKDRVYKVAAVELTPEQMQDSITL